MTLDEIKAAVLNGHTVHWSNESYVVIKDRNDQWLIKCTTNDSCIGLTWADGTTLNGREEQFYSVQNYRVQQYELHMIEYVVPARSAADAIRVVLEEGPTPENGGESQHLEAAERYGSIDSSDPVFAECRRLDVIASGHGFIPSIRSVEALSD